MTLKKLQWIQAVGELAIPLLGFFYFDWSLYFILLFYFIDLLATEVFTWVKVRKIIAFQGIRYRFQQRFWPLAVNGTIVLLLLFFSHLFIYFYQEGIAFIEAIWNFLAYEEPGFPIPQGIILFPLVVLGNYQQYKHFFVQPGLHRRFSWKALLRSRRRALLIGLTGAVAAILIQFTIPALPTVYYLLLILAVKFYVDVRMTM
ncbi:MAG: hypothetical protein ACQERC_11030 [Bacteroidota bacterium]